MWNLFKTLTERDSARLRRLEDQLNDLTADVDICLNTIPKLNARLRQRARRAAEAGDGDSPGDGPDFVVPSSVPPVGGDTSESPVTTSVEGSRPYREELRARARSRGLLPSLSSSHLPANPRRQQLEG